MKRQHLLILLVLLFHISTALAQKDNLRRDDRDFDVPLPNNCDKIIYVVTLPGVIMSLGTTDIHSDKAEMTALLPFRCNAITKTFNNKILAVEADKDISLPVYEFSPSTKSGKYTKWKLPSHNDGGWISGGTDALGRVYFATTTMKYMVRIDLRYNDVEVLWSSKDRIDGGNKITCLEGCNFYVNEKSEVLIKENKRNTSYKVNIEGKPYLFETKNIEGFFNTITVNDWYEFTNDKQQNVSMFVMRDGITIFKDGEYRPKVTKIDTLRFGIVTDIAGCNAKENKKPRIIINEKREKEILDAATKKESIRLEKILFKLGLSELQTASYQELDELVMILLKNKQLKILLEGHTDISGDAEDNFKLSIERVNTCRDYLIKYGVSPTRINTKGYGGTKPLVKMGSESERAVNRRVEIKFVE
ncbi:OmpA family protein [Emticicia sp. ODNR4P]|nr:OmpA family protein [Emticicia sp. ODNR4P]